MGNLFDRFFQNLFTHCGGDRVLMLGLDAAGKTTILYQFKLGEVVQSAPTIGFNVESINYKNISLTVWDIGGQDKIRPLWKHYYQGSCSLIFVVDASDRARVSGNPGSAAEELQNLLKEDALRGIPLLVMANKMDLPGAMTVNELVLSLRLTEVNNRKWFVQPTIANTGKGLWEGLEWLAGALKTER